MPLNILFANLALSLAVCVGCQPTATPPPKNVDTLMEQIRGKKFYWDMHGRPSRYTHGFSDANGKAQTYATRELGKLGMEAKEAVPELIRLFDQREDSVSDDHMTVHYRSEIARTLGAIGQPEAIAPLIAALREKSLRPDADPKVNPTAPRWNEADPDVLVRRDRVGAGPQGIVVGLMRFPKQQHPVIEAQLKAVRAEIEASSLNNDWVIQEIDRALRFFEADEATQAKVVEFLQDDRSWWKMRYLDQAPIQLDRPRTELSPVQNSGATL